jgi:hypothetical protein
MYARASESLRTSTGPFSKQHLNGRPGSGRPGPKGAAECPQCAATLNTAYRAQRTPAEARPPHRQRGPHQATLPGTARQAQPTPPASPQRQQPSTCRCRARATSGWPVRLGGLGPSGLQATTPRVIRVLYGPCREQLRAQLGVIPVPATWPAPCCGVASRTAPLPQKTARDSDLDMIKMAVCPSRQPPHVPPAAAGRILARCRAGQAGCALLRRVVGGGDVLRAGLVNQLAGLVNRLAGLVFRLAGPGRRGTRGRGHSGGRARREGVVGLERG